jgi:hypothetical protein
MGDKEFTAYVKNLDYPKGEFIPQSEAKVLIRYSHLPTVVFTSIRTVNKIRLFKLDEHIERLYNGCRMIEVDPGITPRARAKIGHSRAYSFATCPSFSASHALAIISIILYYLLYYWR